MKTSEAFIQQHIQSLNSPHQWIITSRNNQTIVINSYSSDEFYPYRLVPQHHRKQCRDYQLRQQYTLPNTPKIMLITTVGKSENQLLLLAQRGQFSLQKFIAHFQNNRKSQLQFLLQLTITSQMLMKKYGYFRFTPGMIKASKGPSLLVWISQNQSDNHPQYPIGPIYPINLQKANNQIKKQPRNPIQIMIHSLFTVLNQKIINNTIIQILKEQNEQLTFQFIKKKITKDIKQEYIMSQYTISTPSADKNRRYTEQKKKKVPQFILNRGIPTKEDKKQKKNTSQSFNKKSAVTYSYNQFNKNTNDGIKKIGHPKNIHQKTSNMSDHKFLLSLLSKNSKTDIKQALSSTIQKSQQNNIKFRFTNEGIIQCKQKKQEKIIVRDSGKSVSTSSAQYFSMNSSGKKFFQGTFSTESQTSNSNSITKKNEKSVNSVFSRKNNSGEYDKKQGTFFREITKPRVGVSRIIEQNYQDIHVQSQSQSNRTPRSPSILQTLHNSSKISQNSIGSPGSQFFKDVDLILHSGALSPKMSEQVNNIQYEFGDILDN